MNNSSDLQEHLNKKIDNYLDKESKKHADQKIQGKLNELDKKTDEHLKGLQSKLEHGVKKGNLPFLSTIYFLLLLEQIPVLGVLLVNYLFSLLVSLLVTVGLLIVALIYLVSYFIIYRYPNWVKNGTLGFFFAFVLSFCEAFFVVYIANALDQSEFIMIIVAVLIVDIFFVMLLAKHMTDFKYIYGITLGVLLITGAHALYMYLSEFSWFDVILVYVLSNLYQIFLLMITDSIIRNKEIKDEEFATAIFATLLVFKEKINYTVGLGVTIVIAIINCCKRREEASKV